MGQVRFCKGPEPGTFCFVCSCDEALPALAELRAAMVGKSCDVSSPLRWTSTRTLPTLLVQAFCEAWAMLTLWPVRCLWRLLPPRVVMDLTHAWTPPPLCRLEPRRKVSHKTLGAPRDYSASTETTNGNSSCSFRGPCSFRGFLSFT